MASDRAHRVHLAGAEQVCARWTGRQRGTSTGKAHRRRLRLQLPPRVRHGRRGREEPEHGGGPCDHVERGRGGWGTALNTAACEA